MSISAHQKIKYPGFPTTSFGKGKVWVVLFILIFSSFGVVGQNGVTISSPEPDPTAANPIPIDIHFEDGVDEINPLDFNVTNGDIQNIFREDPNFIYEGTERRLENFQVETNYWELVRALSSGIPEYLTGKLKKAIISIDFNNNNELFYLTLDDGIFKIDENGNAVRVISANEFESPMDLVINRDNGNIYVADAEKGQILVFNPNYDKLEPIGTGLIGDSNSPRGATGLALDDEGNIYVADNFTGNTANQDAIKIYAPNGNLIKKISTYNGQQIQDPYRIAVDKYKNIYVSESGGEQREPRIFIFDKDYNPVKIIQGGEQGNPGSLVIDDYGYLYIIDYEQDFNLTDLFNDPLKVLENYEKIRDSKYTINVFDTNENFRFVKEFNRAELNLPIDLALNNCGQIYINNLKLQGAPPEEVFGYPALIDINFDFTLKKFQRQDNFTINVTPEEPGVVEVKLEDANLFKCGPQPEGEFSIVYQPEEENTPPDAICNSFEVALDHNGNATITAEQVYRGDEELELSINIENFDCSNLGANTVVLTVTDPESALSDTCEATITVVDEMAPVASCVAPFTVELDENREASITVDDIDYNSTDNCSIATRALSQYDFTRDDVGVVPVTLTITDSSGLIDECTVNITVKDNTPPEAICNDFEVALDGNGNATITAEQVYGGDEEFELNIDINNFDCSNLGANTVVLTVTDPESGLSNTCEATITVVDEIVPTIQCPTPKTAIFNPQAGFTVPDYRNEIVVTDNCTSEGELRDTLVQTPGPGVTIYESQLISFSVEDGSGLIDTCSFQLTLKEEEEETPFAFECPDLNPSFNENCEFVVPDYTQALLEQFPQATFSQTPPAGTTIYLSKEIEISGSRNGQTDSCNFLLIVADNSKPQIHCPNPKTASFDPEDGFIVPDYRGEVSLSDNCASEEDLEGNIFQNPAPGVTIFESQQISFTVNDDAGNSADCSFQLSLVEDEEPEPDFEITCVGNYKVELGYNIAAVNIATTEFVEGDTSGMEFWLTEQYFDCSDIGINPLVIEATNIETGETDVCTVMVEVVDIGDPLIICYAEAQPRYIPGGGSYTLENLFENRVSDNCTARDELVLVQDPPAGTIWEEPGTYRVTINATDNYGNTDTCIVDINLIEETSAVSCKPTSISLNDAGIAILDPAEIFDGDANAPEIEELQVNKERFTCSDVGTQSVLLTVHYTDGTTASCTAQVTILDEIAPEAFCIAPGKEFILVNGSVTIDHEDIDDGSTDNCSVSLSISPSTFTTTGTKTVILTATDPSGHIDECSTTIEVVNPPSTPISCKSTTLYLDANGAAVLNPAEIFDGDANASEIEELQVNKDAFTCSDVGTQFVLLTVNYTDGTSASCTAQVTILDEIAPEAFCIAPGKEFMLVNGSVTINPEDIDDGSTDNCSVSLSISPSTFTTTGTKTVTLTATDPSGLIDECSTTIEVVNPTSTPIFCKSTTLSLDAGGIAILNPAEIFDGDANAAHIEKLEASKTEFGCSDIGNSHTVILTVSYSDGTSSSCSAQVTVLDEIAPIVNCLPNQIENYDPATGFEVPDYTGLVEASDNCGISEIIQTPSEGTLIFEDTEINFIVKDAAGNSAGCKFLLELTEDQILEISCPENQVGELNENCQFQVPDYGDLAEVNFEGAFITQVPAAGTIINSGTSVVLTATFGDQTDICSFNLELLDPIAPVAKCILTGSYRLDENGSLTLDPAQIDNGSLDNCGIASMELDRDTFTTADIGDHTITLTVTDAAGNTNSCETTISILPYVGMGNDFACKTSVVLELDENGNAVLTPQDLYTGDPQERIFNISKTNFSCSDVGENYINFTYQGNIDSGTCEIKVEVQDNLAPVVQTNNVTISLDDAGRAEISPALINNGTTDNCGTVNFTLDKSRFSCKDLGENLVNLTATDRNGNSTTATATVTVMGSCDTEPTPGGNGPDEIFIYPNPSPGPFTIATPVGVKIFRVEVFDFRGRFLLSKEFAENVPAYTMDISGVEQAVYVLKIYSSDGKKIRRVIKH